MKIKDLIPWASKQGDTAGSGNDEHPVANLQRDMNRMFDDFWGRVGRPFGMGGSGGSSAGALSDVVDTDKCIEVSIELPGMSEKDIDISLSPDSITIKGEKSVERQEEKKGFFISERSYGSVFRTIPLPAGVDTDKADAVFKNGVLTVTLPKTAEAKAKVKKITVKSA